VVALPDDLDAIVLGRPDDLRAKFGHCAVYLHLVLGVPSAGLFRSRTRVTAATLPQ
jgi:hypothetical protein